MAQQNPSQLLNSKGPGQRRELGLLRAELAGLPGPGRCTRPPSTSSENRCSHHPSQTQNSCLSPFPSAGREAAVPAPCWWRKQPKWLKILPAARVREEKEGSHPVTLPVDAGRNFPRTLRPRGPCTRPQPSGAPCGGPNGSLGAWTPTCERTAGVGVTGQS